MNEPLAEVKHAGANRIVVGVLGVGLTTLIGGAGVVAVYYPLRHAHYALQWALIFLLMAGESAAIHLPSEVILPVGGWLVVREHGLGLWGVVGLSAIAAAGNTLGSALLYAAGRAGGRPLVRRYGRWILLHERDVDAAEERMRSHRLAALFVSRLLPVVRTYAGFVAGLLRVPLPAFISVTFAGSFVWSAAFIGIGVALGANWSRIRAPMEIAGIVMVVLLIAALVAVTVRQMRGAA